MTKFTLANQYLINYIEKVQKMKDILLFNLTTFLKVLTVFFYPIQGIILLVAISTILDTFFGLWKAKKLNENITSKKVRFGLVPKLVSYVGAIMLVYASDVFIINDLTMLMVEVDYISTKVIALALISIEIKSIDESYKAVRGCSFIDKIMKLILKAKDVKKNIQK